MFTQTTLCTIRRCVYYTTGKFSSHWGALVMLQLLFYIATVNTLNEVIICLNHYDLFNNVVTFLTHDVGGMYKFVPLNAVGRSCCMLVGSTLALSTELVKHEGRRRLDRVSRYLERDRCH
jgi:hypothetical protein